MADELDVLLEKVDDPDLRAELRTHIERLRSKRTFGLVFEDHLPERVRLPEHPVRRGTRVVRRDEPGGNSLEVRSVRRGQATVADRDGTISKAAADELVVVAEFGQRIHPGLQRVGSIDRGGDKPAHVVINAENHHALEMLQYTHAGKVDCIYVDPPYNTGARDWKYDNDYVDADDAYRHSKWLAFMQRRLLLAKQLLNPDNSVLIVTIDENELSRLRLLLDQMFPEGDHQTVTCVITPGGTSRTANFSRVEEYVTFVFLGAATVYRTSDSMLGARGDGSLSVAGLWEGMVRRGNGVVRAQRPGQFYPVYVDSQLRRIAEIGEPLAAGDERASVPDRAGLVTVWPIKPDGLEGFWQLGPSGLSRAAAAGTARAVPLNRSPSGWTIQYMKEANATAVRDGRIETIGFEPNGDRILRVSASYRRVVTPKTVWYRPAHDASVHGARLLTRLLPGRSFPFPKSLHAVEDALRFVAGTKPDAVVLDFFAGSGTTAHAVARLNRQDGGRRQAILVTNNEVSADEAKALSAQGYRDGDPEWEALGIFEHITRPRITAAITGRTPDGQPIKGDYRFVDEFPMADGFEENVEFMKLTYLDPLHVELDEAFAAIAPLLWLRAGGHGPVIESRADRFATTERYGILFDPDRWRAFVDELPSTATTAFVVTDSPSIFAGVAAALPDHVDAVRLYESYLQSFAINHGR